MPKKDEIKKEIREEKNKKKHPILKLLILVILIFTLLLFYSMKIEVKNIKVNEYRIENELIPWSFDGFKIVQFADLNYGSTIFEEELKELIDIINKQDADLVLFTGNLVYEGYNATNEELESIVSYLKLIDSTVGKYAVTGMYDTEISDINILLSNAGFKVLENNYDLIYYKGLVPIYLTGLSSYLTTRIDYDSAFSYYKVETEELKEEEDPYQAKYKIVMFNESDAIDELLSYDDSVNLVLTSNSLGGLVKFGKKFLFKQEGSKKYYDYTYDINATKVFVSNGIGTNDLKLRFNNAPSINLYRLNSIN